MILRDDLRLRWELRIWRGSILKASISKCQKINQLFLNEMPNFFKSWHENEIMQNANFSHFVVNALMALVFFFFRNYVKTTFWQRIKA